MNVSLWRQDSGLQGCGDKHFACHFRRDGSAKRLRTDVHSFLVILASGSRRRVSRNESASSDVLMAIGACFQLEHALECFIPDQLMVRRLVEH